MAQRFINTSSWSHIKVFQSTEIGRRAWLAVSRFYGGTAKHTRKMVVARSALETLTWSNESSFKFNDCATQLINHYQTLDRGGQPKTDEEKVMKLLDSMNTNYIPLQTRIKLNQIGVTFHDAVVNTSTSIAQLMPNVIDFTGANWKKRLSNDKYKFIPKQVKKLIGFAKYHSFDKKYLAFLAEKQQNGNDKKRKVSEMSYYGPSKDDAEKDAIDRAISKIVQAFTKDDAPNDDGAPDENPKSSANAGSSLGKENPFGGSRG